MKMPGHEYWKELQEYCLWKGISWKEAAGVALSASFLMGTSCTMLYIILKTSGCGV
jgi:hypothetical protein